jgi:hypothetical protein
MGLGAAGTIAAGSVASGVIGAGASLLGASQAAGAAKDAAQQQKMMYLMTRSDLDPFRTTGANALTDAYSLAQLGPNAGGRDYIDLAYQNLPGKMTQAELEQTPGYQWTLAQGLKAAQGAAAARGLGVSGASLKGAATYATGLADNTYKTQFDVRQKQFEDLVNLNVGQQGNITNQFSRLNSLATLGGNAAAQVGTQGSTLAGNEGKYLTQGGLLSGTGTMNAANALTGAAQNYLGYNAYQNALNPGTSGYGTAAAGTPGFSASGNPVMTGYAPAMVPGQVGPGGFTAA